MERTCTLHTDTELPVLDPRQMELTLVAEEAAPALLAVALPGLVAGAMQTAWVAYALVTVPAREADPAPAKGPQSVCHIG